MRTFRNHGITTDRRQREQAGSSFYEVADLEFNYRITNIQCTVGLSQLKKVEPWVRRRQQAAKVYDEAFRDPSGIRPLRTAANVEHAYNLYVVCDPAEVEGARARVYAELRDQGIGVNVHYVLVHLHPFYQKNFGTGAGLCSVAGKRYAQILSLPIFPRMSDADVAAVIQAVNRVCR